MAPAAAWAANLAKTGQLSAFPTSQANDRLKYSSRAIDKSAEMFQPLQAPASSIKNQNKTEGMSISQQKDYWLANNDASRDW